MSVEQIIKDGAKGLCTQVYIAPSIEEKKLNNAVTAIAPGTDPAVVVAIIDTTLFASGKEGLVFTGDTLYYRGTFAKPLSISYSDIGKAEYKTTEKTDEKGKVTTTKIVTVFDKSDKVLLDIQNPLFKHDKFSELLDAIIAEGGEEGDYQTSLQSQQLAEMDVEVKMAYIKAVCNYLHHGMESIDNKEYAEIISLIVRNNVDNEHRFILRQYLMNKDGLEDNEALVKFLNANVDEGSLKDLKTSLIQDVIRVFRVRESGKEGCDYSGWTDDGFIRALQKMLGVTDEQINFFLEKLQNDEDIINKRQTNSDIEKSLKNLATKAGAVGIPLAALYFSGSLWVYGGSLFLFGGLGPLAIAAGLGFLGYQGLKKLTGMSEIENNSQREIMLQGIIRNSQKSLNFLIEDVNYIAKVLSDELTKGQTAAVMIEKLKRQLIMLSQGASTMSGRVSLAEKEAVIAKLPPKLDMRRFEELTSKPTMQKYRPVVLAGFVATQTKVSDGTTKTEQRLNYDLTLNQLEEIHGVLDNIGYYSMSSAGLASAKGLVKDLFNKAKDAMK